MEYIFSILGGFIGLKLGGIVARLISPNDGGIRVYISALGFSSGIYFSWFIYVNHINPVICPKCSSKNKYETKTIELESWDYPKTVTRIDTIHHGEKKSSSSIHRKEQIMVRCTKYQKSKRCKVCGYVLLNKKPYTVEHEL